MRSTPAEPVHLTSAPIAVAATDGVTVHPVPDDDAVAEAAAEAAGKPSAADVVVHGDVTAACSAVTSRAGWRDALESLAACMKPGGALGNNRLVVQGGEEVRAGIRCVLDRFGIAESRISFVSSSREDRVDIALSSSGLDDAAGLRLRADRNEVATFLTGDEL